MARNMIETATKAEGKLGNYDMTYMELKQLLKEVASGNALEAITIAFNYGFVMGNRATISNKLNRL